MNQSIYHHRSVFLLLPIGLMAIVSYALDKRIPVGIDINAQTAMLEAFRIIIPAFFAVAIGFMLPTISRIAQISAILLNYTAMALFSLANFHSFFSQPTSWIVASLTCTLFFLPSAESEGDSEGLSFNRVLAKLFGTITLPPLTLLAIFVFIKNIEHSISITFTSVFLNSLLSCLFVPLYEIMLTLGFSSSLNSLVSMQVESDTLKAILNSILLTNTLALPAVITSRALFSRSYNRMFLVFLAIMACMSSKIGTCISVELMILLFFFPGTYSVLCISSIALFFVNIYLKLGSLTSFYLLYQPDLVIKNLAFLHLGRAHFAVIILSVAIPFVFQAIVSRVGKINHLKQKLRRRYDSSYFKVSDVKNPDLLAISILKIIGGKSNLREVMLYGESIRISFYSYTLMHRSQLNAIFRKRFRVDQSRQLLELNIGSMAYIVFKRLDNIAKESLNLNPNEIELSSQFNIMEYVQTIQEKNRIERYRLDTDKTSNHQ